MEKLSYLRLCSLCKDRGKVVRIIVERDSQNVCDDCWEEMKDAVSMLEELTPKKEE
jgi:hypothetical protein